MSPARRRRGRLRRRGLVIAALILAASGATAGIVDARQVAPPAPLAEQPPGPLSTPMAELQSALVRLPLAAVLGAALAMRPKRRGTPPRTPAVIHTQIILAIVGAAIMLVVGASLARAFGIVGAANLIRYRSKIEDPKDAGVMLCALAVGLASGVGLYALAVFSTVFIGVALAIIESFEPKAQKRFEVHIKVEKDAGRLRPAVEGVLRRFRVEFDLRSASEEELSYDVQVPFETELDQITDALLNADRQTPVAVDWDEKKTKVA
jgi:uncharacterized membrane protein YhiD involved in acid resistance